MTDQAFKFNDFLQPENTEDVIEDVIENSELEHDEEEFSDDIDVQKVVVEEFAAEKVALEEKIASMEREIVRLKEAGEKLESEKNEIHVEKSNLLEEITALKLSNAKLESRISEFLEKEIDIQERNPNSLALLDRDVELPDRFPGETRDHVLEVIKEAREKAENEGRIRRAQLLESVLVANEPHGNLYKKRIALEKFFADNQNILSGTVIAELERCGISHKKGDEYLLPSEILIRTY